MSASHGNTKQCIPFASCIVAVAGTLTRNCAATLEFTHSLYASAILVCAGDVMDVVGRQQQVLWLLATRLCNEYMRQVLIEEQQKQGAKKTVQ